MAMMALVNNRAVLMANAGWHCKVTCAQFWASPESQATQAMFRQMSQTHEA